MGKIVFEIKGTVDNVLSYHNAAQDYDPSQLTNSILGGSANLTGAAADLLAAILPYTSGVAGQNAQAALLAAQNQRLIAENNAAMAKGDLGVKAKREKTILIVAGIGAGVVILTTILIIAFRKK